VPDNGVEEVCCEEDLDRWGSRVGLGGEEDSDNSRNSAEVANLVEQLGEVDDDALNWTLGLCCALRGKLQRSIFFSGDVLN